MPAVEKEAAERNETGGSSFGCCPWIPMTAIHDKAPLRGFVMSAALFPKVLAIIPPVACTCASAAGWPSRLQPCLPQAGR